MVSYNNIITVIRTSTFYAEKIPASQRAQKKLLFSDENSYKPPLLPLEV